MDKARSLLNSLLFKKPKTVLDCYGQICPVEKAAFFRSVGYRLNKEGYRSEEFDDRKEINVVSIGCSNVFGWSMGENDRFTDLFVAMLAEHTGKSVSNWNLGVPGKSNDYIARSTLCALESLQPEVFLISFTGIGRREYIFTDFDIKNKIGFVDFLPAHWPDVVAEQIPWQREPYEALYNLSNENSDFVNFHLNLKLIELALTQAGVKWMFTLSCHNENGTNYDRYSKIKHAYQHNPHFAGDFEMLDLAADGLHPGLVSNQQLSEKFFNKYKELYGD